MTASVPSPTSAPRGVIASLAAGFENVNTRYLLIVIPLLLDLFLWLGPFVSIRPIMADFSVVFGQAMREAQRQSELTEAQMAQLRTTQENLRTYDPNVLGTLSVPWVGVPSLMAGRLGPDSVWPRPADIPLPEAGPAVLLMLALLPVGVWLGTLYFSLIAHQVRDGRLNWGRLMREVWGDTLQIGVVLAGLAALALAIGVPAVLVLALFGSLAPTLAYLFLLVGLVAGFWLMVFFAFSVHGIVLARCNLFVAVWDSLRLVGRNYSATLSLFAAILLTNSGLNVLWNIPATIEWTLAVGVLGHALVNTALITATFVFYNDRLPALYPEKP